MKRILLLIATLMLLSLAYADSYYSSYGLGIPRYFVTQKAAGMGGAGIAVVDRMALNSLNPAAINVQGITTLGLNLEYEYAINKNKQASVNTGNGNATGLQFIIPIKSGLNAISLLRPLSSSRYTLKGDYATDDLSYSKIIKGNGGLSAASLGFQYGLFKAVSIGALINFNFGSFSEDWKIDFADESFLNSNDNFSTHMWGISGDFGAIAKVTNRLQLGGIYKTASNMQLETSIALGNSYHPPSISKKLTYPGAWGFGTAYQFPKVLAALDYFKQSWTSYKYDGSTDKNFKDFWRLSAGLEFQASRETLVRYRKRVCYRLGGYLAQLPFSENGQSVREQFLTIGLGLPFSVTAGRVDMALEFGQRGNIKDLSYKDTVIRLTGSITGGEFWFMRR